MKIVQQIQLGPAGNAVNTDTFQTQYERVAFDPTLYSGKTHIYYKVTAWLDAGASEGEIELWDYTNSVQIAVITVTNTTAEQKTSSDLISVLTTACTIGWRARYTVGTPTVYVSCPALQIEQDDEATNRKTAAYLMVLQPFTGSFGSAWFTGSGTKFKIPLTSYDGTVHVQLDTILKSGGTGTNVHVRLWDVTLGQAVPNSTLETNVTDYTHITSSDLTLDSTHEYCVQYGASNSLKFVIFALVSLVIKSEAFTKIASIPCAFGPMFFSAYDASNLIYPYQTLDTTKITGVDFLSYKLLYGGLMMDEIAEGLTFELYDKTGSAPVADTTQTYPENYDYPDVTYLIDVSLTNHEYARSMNYPDYTEAMAPSCIYAIQEEINIPTGAIGPDPSQPTGYHCFMQNFIKNMLSGYVPLLTPDGVNRTW